MKKASDDSNNSQEMSPGRAPTLARAATLARIAEHVGVSKVAVSVVLNNSRSQVRVSAATRQRILDAARELDYQPNVLARSLIHRRTNIIGFYSGQRRMFDPLYPFYGYILKGLLEGCERHKKNFLIHGTFHDVSEDDIYFELLNGQIDGLILYARVSTPFTERLAESHLPVVTVGNEVPGLPCITIDDELGGRLLVRHLVERGYKRTLYLLANEELPPSIKRRLKGFLDEAALLSLEVEVYPAQSPWPYDKDLEEIMAREKRPDVIACFSDFTAHQVLTWCKKAGWRVPEDIAITGFDGFDTTFGAPSGFTTVAAHWDVVAETAVTYLVEQCDGAAIPIYTELPVELVVGETT